MSFFLVIVYLGKKKERKKKKQVKIEMRGKEKVLPLLCLVLIGKMGVVEVTANIMTTPTYLLDCPCLLRTIECFLQITRSTFVDTLHALA